MSVKKKHMTASRLVLTMLDHSPVNVKRENSTPMAEHAHVSLLFSQKNLV